MKKVFFLLTVICLITGCDMVKVKQSNIENIIDTVLKEDKKLYNSVFSGYKFYAPQGVSIKSKNDYNIKLTDKLTDYYLYVDIVAYYNKTKISDKENNKDVFSKKIINGNKEGYASIKEIDNKYYVKVIYNYAKIETIVDKKDIKNAFINICYILSSINYNDKVLETLIGENILIFKEEKFNLFESKRENGNFLDYDYDYVDKNNVLPDEDEIKMDKK